MYKKKTSSKKQPVESHKSTSINNASTLPRNFLKIKSSDSLLINLSGEIDKTIAEINADLKINFSRDKLIANTVCISFIKYNIIHEL